MDRLSVTRVALCVAAALAACSGGGRSEADGLGRRLAGGNVKRLLASADGTWLASLEGCVEVRGRFLQPGTATCDVRLTPTGGGDGTVVARAVPTLPHAAGFAPEGNALAVLAGYDFEAGAGTLWAGSGGALQERGTGVTFHGFVPGGGGALLAVANGKLLHVGADGSRREVSGADGVSTFDLAVAPAGGAPAGLARRPAAAGGALLALAPGLAKAAPVALATTEYGFARRGDGWGYARTGQGGTELWLSAGSAPRLAGRGVRGFAFAPGGEAVAWISEAAPGKQGDLHEAPARGAERRLAREVGEFRWAANAPRLAWLEQYDPRSRSGTLSTGGGGAATRSLGKDVTEFELSGDGGRIAWLRHTTEGGYSVDLWESEAGGSAAPRRVARGVFGFAWAPDARWLYYRTRCTRNGDACDLERVAAAGSTAAEQVAAGIKSFEFDPRDGERLLVTFQRADLVALDLAVWKAGKLTSVDRGALPGSIRFLGPDSRRLAYAVVEPKRAGVYVATLP